MPYDRPPLSKQVLAGAWEVDRIALRGRDELDAEWRLGTTATRLDLAAGEIEVGSDGERLACDGVVIATGASVRTLPGTPPLEGVFVLRTLDDCLALRVALETGPPVVVIGAGFIGSEVAATARSLGLDVTVLEALPVPLERVLGAEMGAVCGRLHTDNGTDLRLGTGVSGFESDDARRRVTGVLLTDGSVVAAEVVVVGIGVVPNTAWLEGSGLTIDNGVVCDERCRAVGGGGRVVAAGDLARWHNQLFETDMRVEHWTNAAEQGRAAALALLHGDAAPSYAPVPYFWSDQYGSKIQYVGHAGPSDDVRVVDGSIEENKFVAAYTRGGRIVAALTLNWPAKMIAYQKLIAERASLPS